MARATSGQTLPSAWRLARTALADFKSDWKHYVLILSIVAIPINLLGLSGSLSDDDSISAYMSFAAIVMNVALIWAIVQRQATGIVPRPAEAYYDGGIALVRFLIVTAMLVLMLIPAALAVLLYLASTSAAAASGAALAEGLLIGSVCLLLALPSVWLLLRFALAPMVAVATGLHPIAALRYGRSLTLGRFWQMLGRYAGLIGFLVVVSIPIALVTVLFSYLKLITLAMFFFQLATTLTALPLANLYLFHLYRELEPHPRENR